MIPGSVSEGKRLSRRFLADALGDDIAETMARAQHQNSCFGLLWGAKVALSNRDRSSTLVSPFVLHVAGVLCVSRTLAACSTTEISRTVLSDLSKSLAFNTPCAHEVVVDLPGYPLICQSFNHSIRARRFADFAKIQSDVIFVLPLHKPLPGKNLARQEVHSRGPKCSPRPRETEPGQLLPKNSSMSEVCDIGKAERWNRGSTGRANAAKELIDIVQAPTYTARLNAWPWRESYCHVTWRQGV